MEERGNGTIDILDSNGNISGNRINLSTRTIIIYGFIDEHVAKEISDVLPMMDLVRDKPITIKINSIGGNLPDTQAIVTEMEKCQSTILVDIVGMAFSGAAVLALVGDEIQMSKYGLYMLHYPRWETDDAPLKQHKLDVKITTEHFERLIKGLLIKTKISIDEFRKQAKDDWYMTPKVCLKKGIVHNVY
jgi:ATP-dependent protease ClpP protease subunit